MLLAAHSHAKDHPLLSLEGQPKGQPQAEEMGQYRVMEGEEVNGRPVYQHARGADSYIYSAQWYLCDEESMRAREASGWLRVDDAALTPDQVTGVWEVRDANSDWVDALSVNARVMSKEEVQQQEEEEKHNQMQGELHWLLVLL